MKTILGFLERHALAMPECPQQDNLSAHLKTDKNFWSCLLQNSLLFRRGNRLFFQLTSRDNAEHIFAIDFSSRMFYFELSPSTTEMITLQVFNIKVFA